MITTLFSPSAEDLAEVEIWPSGEIVESPRVDQAFQVAALMRGEVGNAEWMKRLTIVLLYLRGRRED